MEDRSYLEKFGDDDDALGRLWRLRTRKPRKRNVEGFPKGIIDRYKGNDGRISDGLLMRYVLLSTVFRRSCPSEAVLAQ